MNTKTLLKALLVSSLLVAGVQAQAAGYLKIGDIKGESTRADTAAEQNQQLKSPDHNKPQAASMTPEQAEKLRKQIKQALKPPCKLNSNKPCPPPCGMNSNC